MDFCIPSAAGTTLPCRYFGSLLRTKIWGRGLTRINADNTNTIMLIRVYPRLSVAIPASSFHHHRPAYRRGLADQEHQRDDHQEQTAHHPESVGKGQHAGLLQQCSVDQPL